MRNGGTNPSDLIYYNRTDRFTVDLFHIMETRKGFDHNSSFLTPHSSFFLNRRLYHG